MDVIVIMQVSSCFTSACALREIRSRLTLLDGFFNYIYVTLRGLGDGRLRDIGISSNVGRMEKELEKECAARKAADATRIETEQKMQKKLKVVGNQFNYTLQTWYNSMQQLCSHVPGVVLPPFTPLSVDDTNEENYIGDEENYFDEDDYFGDDE